MGIGQEQQEMPLEGGLTWTADMDRRLRAVCLCFYACSDPLEQRAENMRRAFGVPLSAGECEQRAAQRGFEVMKPRGGAVRFGKEAS